MVKRGTKSGLKYQRVCGECGKDIDYPFDKLYRLEEWPAVDAFEEEFCSRKCLLEYIVCRYCRYMVNSECTFKDKDTDCVLKKHVFEIDNGEQKKCR